MYSIKGTKDIEFNYNISSIRKISDTEYQYHGKPNSPNLVLSNGIKRISYVAERIEMKPRELIIYHSATSNFPKRAMVIFPLVVSKGRETVIDRLLGMEMYETLDLDIGSEITDFTMEINETQKSAYIIRLSGGLPISEKPVIVEGLSSCGLSELERTDLRTAITHAETQGGLQNHTMDDDDFNKKLNKWLDTDSKCYKDGKHYMKDNTEYDVSMNDTDKISGAKEIKQEGDSDGLSELSPAQCSTIGGTKVIGGSSLGGGGGSGISPNQEMECFPNEGGVFNKRFYIIYDISSNEKFIAENGVDILHKDKEKNNNTNNKPLREAMNAEVKRLKEHIEKLGGIYVPTATIPSSFAETNGGDGYRYIKSTGIKNPATEFFTENKEIDIFITYVADQTPPKLRMFSSIDESGKLVDEGALTKPKQVMECILVAVKKGTDEHILMNAKKFSEDYLNKDFNRYTHISIPGYMTDTENQSMKAIIYLLAMILTTLVSYYTVPGFYKIAIKKITRNQRSCSTEGIDFENYYKVTAFNYFFTIITIIIPSFIMIFTGSINGILMVTIAIGIICVLTMIARFTNDANFFYDFYPRNGLITCNKTKDFVTTGSRFKVFTHIPSSLSALFSG